MPAEQIVFDRLHLEEVCSGADPTQQLCFACPISGTSGAQALTVAYTTLNPGGAIPWHYENTDDEVLLLLEGDVEVTTQLSLDNDAVPVGPGGAVHIAARKPHMVRNIGKSTAKLVHLFGHPRVTATFADPLVPIDTFVIAY